MTFAAVLAAVLVTIVAAFQLALALGAPLGKAAWGGRNEPVLPRDCGHLSPRATLYGQIARRGQVPNLRDEDGSRMV